MVTAIGSLSTITLQTSPGHLAIILSILNVSTAFIFTPMSNTMYSSLPHEAVRMASGLYALKRQLGRSLGSAFISVFFAMRLNTHGSRLFDDWAMPQSAARTAQETTEHFLRDVQLAQPGSSATSLIQDLLLEEATIDAFSDCFLLVCIALLVIIIPLLFLKDYRTPEQKINEQAQPH
jgi:DHA2 family multidrug resistance protein